MEDQWMDFIACLSSIGSYSLFFLIGNSLALKKSLSPLCDICGFDDKYNLHLQSNFIYAAEGKPDKWNRVHKAEG